MRLVRLATAILFIGGITPATPAPDPALVARGKYLVENTGACPYCHTPKLENGELDKAKWMKGAVLEFGPLKTIRDWHKTAPDLTPSGTLYKKWGPDGLLKFLETGKTPKDTFPGPPMPPYRFSREDAVAVLEYLKTLP